MPGKKQIQFNGITHNGTQAFLDYVATLDHDECIDYGNWAAVNKITGYGKTCVNGEHTYAHRYVCEQAHGPMPQPGMQAAHKPEVCHNPSCVNKNHLRWATAQSNAADRKIDGTCNTQKNKLKQRVYLTAQQALEARWSNARGLETQQELADRLCVSQPTVAAIVRSKTWKQLPSKEVLAAYEECPLHLADGHTNQSTASSPIDGNTARYIFRLAWTGRYTAAQVAEHVGVTKSAVYQIKQGYLHADETGWFSSEMYHDKMTNKAA